MALSPIESLWPRTRLYKGQQVNRDARRLTWLNQLLLLNLPASAQTPFSTLPAVFNYIAQQQNTIEYNSKKCYIQNTLKLEIPTIPNMCNK